ncbi:MAG: hypothetical protein M3O31_18270 [Acidobacteriota bacterium]|nr:hypothetical protein [Acidobacteriota bacterium]
MQCKSQQTSVGDVDGNHSSVTTAECSVTTADSSDTTGDFSDTTAD